MTYEDINNLVARIAESLGCEYHYYTEEERGVVKTPYLLFDLPNRDDFKADNINYVLIQRVNIEYDSKDKDIDAEKKIEDILKSEELAYSKDDTRNEDQNAYEVMYSMEVIINA